jgi:hypothetical protein
MAEGLAGKLENPGALDEKLTSGAEAHVDSIAFMPRINPRPTSKRSFSASCEAVPIQNSH